MRDVSRVGEVVDASVLLFCHTEADGKQIMEDAHRIWNVDLRDKEDKE